MLTMLATALLGGQVFAEVTETAVDNYEKTEDRYYYGKYSDSESVSGGNVTVKKETTGEVPNDAHVIGGRAKAGEVSNNMVTMQGGTVQAIDGGWGFTGASDNKVTMQGGTVSGTIYGGNGGTAGDSYNNTVIMTGGSVKTIYGGGSGGNYTASGNVVIVTGGSISILCAGNSTKGVAQNNKLHLVGKGASNVNIADAQGNSVAYNGSNVGIKLKNVFSGTTTSGTSTGNSIDIYGTGIEISERFSYMQVLTFNITNDAVAAQTPEVAVTLTSTSPNYALDLADIDLRVKDLNVEEWSAGMTVTLVKSEQEIKGLESGKAVNIMKDGKAVALGKLVLSDGNKTLSLTVQGKVPEPATSSLSLLALAGLCVRRRRK